MLRVHRQYDSDLPRPFESRSRILDVSFGVVEDLQSAAGRDERRPQEFCADFQICLPYRGLFVWHVGKDEVVGDPNQIVFVRGGEAYRMSGPSDVGYAEVIITPDLGLLSELARVNRQPLFEHPLFSRRALRAGSDVQALRSRLLHWAIASSPLECLDAE